MQGDKLLSQIPDLVAPALTDYYYAINADGTIQGKVTAQQIKELLGGPDGLYLKAFEINIGYADFQPDGTLTKTIDSGQLPAGYIPYQSLIECVELAAGGTINGVGLQIEVKGENGISGSAQAIVNSGQGFGGGAYIPHLNEWNTNSNSYSRMNSLSVGLTLQATLTVKTGVIDDLTSGSWKITVICSKRVVGANIIFP